MRPYRQTLRFLYDLQRSGIKIGLDNTRSLLDFLDHPERKYPSVHLAGTNGKGSTASMIAAVLTAAGYRTGLYTSPHLRDFSERIRIDGEKISGQDLFAYTRSLMPIIRRRSATFFEATTAIAFKYFADRNVDVAVVETGLGGRWDATNVLTPVLSIITSIGLEHQDYLGKSIGAIAREKAGIIKKNVPCVVGNLVPEAKAVVDLRALDLSSRIYPTEELTSVSDLAGNLLGSSGNFRVMGISYPRLNIELAGPHQIQNVRAALLGLELLRHGPARFRMSNHAVRSGLASIRGFTGLSGRLQLIRQYPPLIIDVAHNPDAIEALTAGIRSLVFNRIPVVLGVLRDKDYRKIISLLAPIARNLINVSPGNERGRAGSELTDFCHSRGIRAITCPDPRAGLHAALDLRRNGEPILITGSHYVAGKVMEELDIKV